MHLIVNDPTLWPTGMQQLHFARAAEVKDSSEWYVVRADGADQAVLQRSEADAWAMTLEHGEDVRIAVEEAWELRVRRADGGVDQRMLIRAQPSAPGQAPDPGVMTWAALGVLWELSGREPGRG